MTEAQVAGRLRREIKQTRPFSSIHEEVVLSMARTADHLAIPIGEIFRESGLSHSQYNVLRILRGARPNGLPCGEISERMVQRDPDLTRLLDRMETRGLVSRSRDTADRRVVLATITDQGLELLASLDEPIKAANKRILGHMSRERLELLCELLEEARGLTGDGE